MVRRFDDKWYDTDELRLIKNRTDSSKQQQEPGHPDQFLDFAPASSAAQGGTIQVTQIHYFYSFHYFL